MRFDSIQFVACVACVACAFGVLLCVTEWDARRGRVCEVVRCGGIYLRTEQILEAVVGGCCLFVLGGERRNERTTLRAYRGLVLVTGRLVGCAGGDWLRGWMAGWVCMYGYAGKRGRRRAGIEF